MSRLFEGIFDSGTAVNISVKDFLICLFVSLILGVILALSYTVKNEHSQSFVMTLAILPAVVCVVIMMVNGNIGAGVAVAGAFSLVRFRSSPGSAKEITAIFLGMGSGLISGMGYIGFAVLFTVIMCAVLIVYNLLTIRSEKRMSLRKTVKITVPEDLDYVGAFEDVFGKYSKSTELIKVKTTNMGSMFRLTYDVTLKDASREKEMIDELRVRNGNLEILVSRHESSISEL